MLQQIKPLLLIILDGWGYRKEKQYNAIAAANTPHWDYLWQHYPHTLISASGLEVGLPEGQMGNSEVGHLNIGSGRIVYQDFTRIEEAIKQGQFFDNPVLHHAFNKAVNSGKAVHILGLLSPGGVHSHERHIHAMLEMAVKAGCRELYLHAFLDGRDTPPASALASLEAIENKFHTLGHGSIASIIGRYYAMDRDQRWDRVQAAFELLTNRKSEFQADSAKMALEMAYARGETDEFVKATAISHKGEFVCIQPGDIVIFANYRADRMRQLARAFTQKDFTHFSRASFIELGECVTLTQYATDIQAKIVYPPLLLNQVLGEYLANQGYKQLRVAETEKYAHVTFFLNGGREEPYPGEERILIPSLKVATYDLEPKMSAYEITQTLNNAIHNKAYDFIVCNYANPDMVGHTGNFDAAIKAIEVIDECLGKLISALKSVGGEMVITADHGNVECMHDEKTGQSHTAHTIEPVPFLYVGRQAEIISEKGLLADVAPTLLHILGLSQPIEMTGKSLLQIKDCA
ncbi:MAG: 2,3-bisphosphoglycerate-independent phosphoglycerate mutase [Legionellaceae bacterium]